MIKSVFISKAFLFFIVLIVGINAADAKGRKSLMGLKAEYIGPGTMYIDYKKQDLSAGYGAGLFLNYADWKRFIPGASIGIARIKIPVPAGMHTSIPKKE